MISHLGSQLADDDVAVARVHRSQLLNDAIMANDNDGLGMEPLQGFDQLLQPFVGPPPQLALRKLPLPLWIPELILVEAVYPADSPRESCSELHSFGWCAATALVIKPPLFAREATSLNGHAALVREGDGRSLHRPEQRRADAQIRAERTHARTPSRCLPPAELC